MTQFNPSQQTEAVALLEQMAWGDMDYAICGLEICLRRALDATAEEFLRWENDLRPAFEEDGYDEFNVPDDLIANMQPEDKLAYVGRLLRSLSDDYGVTVEFEGVRMGLRGHDSDSSPAVLLRGLNDILWMPMQGGDERL
jgi:hypothetical protein